jgi:hypothetical protein
MRSGAFKGCYHIQIYNVKLAFLVNAGMDFGPFLTLSDG